LGLKHFLSEPINWLLPVVPLAFVFEHADGVSAAVTFGTAALGIVPLAALLVHATEQIADRTGPALGGLLNATFGNAPELIIALVALRAGQVELVKASIVGVILGNLLFVLGLSFLLSGLRYHSPEYNPQGVRIQASMLMIAAIALIVPSGFHNYITPDGLEQGLNNAVAVVLLAAYALSLVFILKTHPEVFAAIHGAAAPEGSGRWSTTLAVSALVVASALLAFLSEILVGAVEETARSLALSKAFIGVIVLALVGGAAESYAAVVTARKDRLDLTLGIALGSTLQIALFVAPVLVLASEVIAPRPMDLVMGTAGSLLIFLSVLVTAMVAGDGRSNWFKGLLLLCAYAIIALMCYFLPDDLAAR
jgi:Ca2+:H+ antiporter